MVFVSPVSVYPMHGCPHKPEKQEYILRDLHPAMETGPFIAKNSKHTRPSPKISCRKTRTFRGFCLFLWNPVKAPSISKKCSKPWALQPCEQRLTQPSGIDCERHRSVTISFYICSKENLNSLQRTADLALQPTRLLSISRRGTQLNPRPST